MRDDDKDSIWDVLMEECGAPSRQTSTYGQFMHHFPDCREFRFQGDLGFGGKVYWERPGIAKVTCYAEDLDDARLDRIRAANKRLVDLFPV